VRGTSAAVLELILEKLASIEVRLDRIERSQSDLIGNVARVSVDTEMIRTELLELEVRTLQVLTGSESE